MRIIFILSVLSCFSFGDVEPKKIEKVLSYTLNCDDRGEITMIVKGEKFKMSWKDACTRIKEVVFDSKE